MTPKRRFCAHLSGAGVLGLGPGPRFLGVSTGFVGGATGIKKVEVNRLERESIMRRVVLGGRKAGVGLRMRARRCGRLGVEKWVSFERSWVVGGRVFDTSFDGLD
jgi:hypothetical protein